MDIRDEMTRQVASSLAKQTDEQLKRLFDEHMPGWTLDEVCERVTTRPKKSYDDPDVYCIDGRAVLAIGPVTSTTGQDDPWTIHYQQQVRRLA